MTILLSDPVKNARLDAIEDVIGVSGVLKIFSGGVPISTDISDTGVVLATIQLPSDWMLPAVSGAKYLNGVWSDSSADNTGVATYFRLFAADGSTCGMQGTVGTFDEDMIVLTTSFVATQPFTITEFTMIDGN